MKMKLAIFLEQIDDHMRKGINGTAFRGQSRNWPLVPKGFRSPFDQRKIDEAVEWNRTRFRQWKAESIPLLKDLALRNEWDWLACAQHHSLATPLLDWTNNPLVALYFASCGGEGADGEVTIWDFSSERFNSDGDPWTETGIVVFRPPPLFHRLHRQNGLLSFHPKKNVIADEKLSWIKVKAEDKAEMLQVLHRMGVDRYNLFGDLDSLAYRANWVSRQDLSTGGLAE
jgi:hypothetical protein